MSSAHVTTSTGASNGGTTYDLTRGLSWNENEYGSTLTSRKAKSQLHKYQENRVDDQSIVILVIGASGDVAKKKIYPALLELHDRGDHISVRKNGENTGSSRTVRIYGFARTKLTTKQFRTHIRSHFPLNTMHRTDEAINNFLSRCHYYYGSGYDDEAAIMHLLSQLPISSTRQQMLIVYLAIPPNLFPVITLTIRNAIRTTKIFTLHNVRIILEKPFGHDTESCRTLISTLQQQQWQESNLFRIDHYLGKVAIRDIIRLRHQIAQKASFIAWNNRSIQSVHILLKETLTIEGRGGYYDAYGVVRDVIQNHLLQILTLLIMEIPQAKECIRDCKVQVLQHISAVTLSDCVFGQYTGYVNDATIENKYSITPTYACIRLFIHHKTNPKWVGVPFYLEAGKALDANVCEVKINFKNSTTLVIRIQPSPSVHMESAHKNASDRNYGPRHNKYSEYDITDTASIGDSGNDGPPLSAYATLILDALHGEATNFVRDDELLEAWRIFTPVLHEYERNVDIQPVVYPKGSSGPDNRNAFLQQFTHRSSL